MLAKLDILWFLYHGWPIGLAGALAFLFGTWLERRVADYWQRRALRAEDTIDSMLIELNEARQYLEIAGQSLSADPLFLLTSDEALASDSLSRNLRIEGH